VAGHHAARAGAAPAGGAHHAEAACLYRRRLLGEIARVAARTVTAANRTRTFERDLAVGIVACLQTHGSRADWHPHLHLHLLVIDGGFRPDGALVSWPVHPEQQPDDATDIPGKTVQVAVSQTDMLATIIAFALLLVDGLKTVEVSLSDDEAESYRHLWRVFAVAKGLPPPGQPDDGSWVPANLAEARAFWATDRRNNLKDPTRWSGDWQRRARLEVGPHRRGPVVARDAVLSVASDGREHAGGHQSSPLERADRPGVRRTDGRRQAALRDGCPGLGLLTRQRGSFCR